MPWEDHKWVYIISGHTTVKLIMNRILAFSQDSETVDMMPGAGICYLNILILKDNDISQHESILCIIYMISYFYVMHI